MSHHRDTWVQYEEALCDHFLSTEEDKRDLERMSALRYEGDIEDYMTQKTYYNTKLGLKGPAWVAQIALGLLSWFKDCCSMKLGRTYDEEDYEEAITVVSLRHEERQREIEHEKNLDEARSKKDKGKGKEISKPESSSHRGDRKKPYDKGQKKTRFSNTSKSKEKDEPKRTHHNKEEALKGIPASLQEKRREKKLCLRCGKPNHWWGICNGEIMAMSGRKAAALRQKKQKVDSSDDEGTAEPSSSKKAKVSAVALTPQPLISESEPMDTTPTRKAWAVEEMVDTTGRILYEVDSGSMRL
jgi:hypothetical protein